MLVREIMTQPVVTVELDASVRSATELLVGRGFTALPVVDDEGLLKGIITEADVLRDRVRHDPYTAMLHEEVEACAPPGRVDAVMTAEVVAFDPWADVADVVRRMRSSGLRSVPVIDRRGAVVGIVSRRDVLRSYTRSDAEIAADVGQRLADYAGSGRWSVSVDDGVVSLGDAYGSASEQHSAKVVASAVRGVVDVHIVPMA